MLRRICWFLAIVLCFIVPVASFADDCDDAARLIESGNRALEKDKEKAYGFYDTALKLCPSSPDAHFNIGLVYLKSNNLDNAAAEFQKVIDVKPDHDMAYVDLTWILIEKGRDVKRGVELAEKRLGSKEDPKLMALLAMGLYREGRNAEAVKWMLRASSKDPSNKDRYEALLQQMVAGKSLPQVADAPSRPLVSPADEKLPELRADAHAIVIGIDYKGRQDVPNLMYAAEDAQKIYDVLTDARYGGVPKENATLLINDKANRNNIKSALRKIKNEGGYVYVYYSGHGAPKIREDKLTDAYLVPYDVDISSPEALDDTAIKVSEVQKLIDASGAKGVMVALDACFTGVGKSIIAKGGKPLVLMTASSELIKPTGAGKVILTSSASNQQSWEDEKEIKGGIFSHYLLEGMTGKAAKDVWVNVDELAGYVKANVAKAAKRLKGEDQTPQVSGTGDFAVTRNWQVSRVMDADSARIRLKSAYEKNLIGDEQLNRALDELKTRERSRTLKSFLEGKIDEKKFGEMY